MLFHHSILIPCAYTYARICRMRYYAYVRRGLSYANKSQSGPQHSLRREMGVQMQISDLLCRIPFLTRNKEERRSGLHPSFVSSRSSMSKPSRWPRQLQFGNLSERQFSELMMQGRVRIRCAPTQYRPSRLSECELEHLRPEAFVSK